MDEIIKICKKHKIKIIEDAAEVLGLKYKKNIVVLLVKLEHLVLCK